MSSNPGETKKDVDDIQRQSVGIFAAGDAPHLTFFQKVMGFVMAANAAFILTTARKKCIL